MSEALLSQISEITLADNMDLEEGDEENLTEKHEKETAESWLRSHLLSLLPCDEIAVDTFLLDTSPVTNLISCEERCRTVFITVQKTKMVAKEKTEILPTVHFDVEKLERRGAMRKARPKKKSQILRRKTKNTRSRSKSSSMSPVRKSKEGKKKSKKTIKTTQAIATEKEKAIAEEITKLQLEKELQLSLPQVADTVLSWHLDRSIPLNDHFVFIVNKLEAALSTTVQIFEHRRCFEMDLDILLAFSGINERKMGKDCQMEKALSIVLIFNAFSFIIDCIISHFCVEARGRCDSTESRSIQTLLLPVIQKFCANTEIYDRNCLLLQLSFFDIDILDDKTDIESSANRLKRAVNTLRILNFLYGENTCDWCRRVFLLLNDIFSTILARHVTRKCTLLVNYDKYKIRPICSSFLDTVLTIRELSQVLFDSLEDRAPVEKLVFSFNVVAVLEEEVDEIVVKVAELHCKKRDTAMDRSGIREAQRILKQLSDYLEENCMESAVESSNLDSLRMLARNLSSFQRRLDGVIAMLPM